METNSFTAEDIKEVLSSLDMYHSPKTLLATKENFESFKEAVSHFHTWHIDLFSPLGLLMLFPNLKAVKELVRRKQKHYWKTALQMRRCSM